jgi:hypothetical protein
MPEREGRELMLPPVGGRIPNGTRLAASETRDWSDVNGRLSRGCAADEAVSCQQARLSVSV